jgi:hypothetical protein
MGGHQRDRIVDKGKRIVARPHVRVQGIRLLRVEGPVITGTGGSASTRFTPGRRPDRTCLLTPSTSTTSPK